MEIISMHVFMQLYKQELKLRVELKAFSCFDIVL